MFLKKKEVKNQARKFDKLITWLIIGWALASMIWISKTDKWKEVTENVKKMWNSFFSRWYRIFWKIMIWALKIFNKK